MKIFKKVLGSCVFLGIGAVAFVCVSYILRPLDPNLSRLRMTGFYANEDDSLDIVVLGSSSVYRYFDNPYLWEEFGFTSYDVSTPSQSPLLLADLTDEVYKTQTPELIIVETRRFMDLNNKNSDTVRLRQTYDNIKYSRNRVEMINAVVDTWPERIESYFDIITYHDGWEDFSYDKLKYYDNEEPHELKGWVVVHKARELEAPKPDSGEGTIPLPESLEDTLREYLEKCRTEKIPVLFISTPWQITQEQRQMNRYMGEVIGEYGFSFLDCNLYAEEIGLDFKKDFLNSKHTNLVGAEKVTKFIGDYIEKNYDIDAEHSREVTDDWNRVAEQYEAEAVAAREKIARN